MKVSATQPHDDPRRRMPRHATDAIQCGLGEVLDLSGSGMRVAIKGRCAIRTGQVLPLKLKTPHGTMTLSARVVWRRRSGLLGGAQVGLHFDGIKPSQSVALATIARFGFIAPDGVKPAQDTPASVGQSPTQVEANIVLAEYYERLGLPTDASPQDVKEAYRKLARTYHPDVAPGPENQRKFMLLREAYDLINDHHRHAG
ncbi:MAG: DnaJ domain-containing protein [Planctomycetota bacterium]